MNKGKRRRFFVSRALAQNAEERSLSVGRCKQGCVGEPTPLAWIPLVSQDFEPKAGIRFSAILLRRVLAGARRLSQAGACVPPWRIRRGPDRAPRSPRKSRHGPGRRSFPGGGRRA